VQTQIHTGIDFDKPGRQWATLSVPYSYNLSGRSQLQIPIATIPGGDGPTVLLMAGNHGDGYPGQIAIISHSAGRESLFLFFFPVLKDPRGRGVESRA